MALSGLRAALGQGPEGTQPGGYWARQSPWQVGGLTCRPLSPCREPPSSWRVVGEQQGTLHRQLLGPAPSSGAGAVVWWGPPTCVRAGCAASRRWPNPAAAGQRSLSRAGCRRGSLGGCSGLGRAGAGSWECSLAQHAAVRRRGHGPTTCSHDRWPWLWWHQQIWDPLSWTGGPAASRTAQLGVVPCGTTPRRAALPGPACTNRFWPSSAQLQRLLWLQGLQLMCSTQGSRPGPPGLSVGAGWGARASRQGTPGGGSWGARLVGLVVGGREELASCSPGSAGCASSRFVWKKQVLS